MSDSESDGAKAEELYDPNQDPEEKSRIREGYRVQLKDLEESAKDFKHLEVSQLVNGVNMADLAFAGVKAPSEAILDSRLLTTVSALSAQKARDFNHDAGGFDTDEFIARMVTFLGGSRMQLDDDEDDGPGMEIELNWAKLGWKALQRSRRVPGFEFMLGPLSIEQKKKAQVKRAKAEKETGPAVKPDEVTAESANNEPAPETDTALVAELAALLEIEGPINVFKLCVNPHSFSQTIENFFYLSFLLKDGKICITFNDDDPNELECYVPEVEAEVIVANTDGDYPKHQGVWQIDEETWKMAIEAYDITEPLFPHRPAPSEQQYAFNEN